MSLCRPECCITLFLAQEIKLQRREVEKHTKIGRLANPNMFLVLIPNCIKKVVNAYNSSALSVTASLFGKSAVCRI